MRKAAFVPVAVVLLAGAAIAADAGPNRKAGYWETTVTLPPMMGGGTIKGQYCTDAAAEAKTSALAGNPGDQCGPATVRKTPAGYSFSIRCNAGAGMATTNGTATGDFQKTYRLEAVTVFDKPPIPSMKSMRTVTTGRWLGPCPAGRKPGDMVVGGRVTNILKNK